MTIREQLGDLRGEIRTGVISDKEAILRLTEINLELVNKLQQRLDTLRSAINFIYKWVGIKSKL